MTRSFQSRINLSHIVVIIVALITFSLLALPRLENIYVSSLEDYLKDQGKVLAELVALQYEPEIEPMQPLAQRIAQESGTRITIISSGGVVLGDSQYEPAKMENHRTRPEIRKALDHGEIGVIRRYSRTLGYDMLYVAVPVHYQTQIIGAVRLAVKIDYIHELQRHLAGVFFLAVLVATIVGALAALLISRRLYYPLAEITNAAQDMAGGNLSRRVYHFEDDDFGKLADAFNSMAYSLNNNINEISLVNDRLKTVLDTTLNGLLLVDTNQRIEFVNPAMHELLGLDRDTSYNGQKLVEVVRSYDLVRLIEQVLASAEQFNREVTLYTRGETMVEAMGVPVITGGQNIKGALLVIRDITRIKRLEEVRKDFAANVSHELKTPIAAISGFAETLINEADRPDTVREFAGIIFNEAGRMDRMIKNLMNISRLETGAVTLKRERLDLAEVARETAELLTGRGTEFEFNVDGAAVVMADRDLLIQVFTNLFDNAIKYSEPPARISINIINNRDHVKVEVHDQGIGISESELSRVYERFYRVDKARSRQTGGAGLGLSIVRHIIEAHGGTVGVTSILGEGSTFYFELPTTF
ncbi:MAG: ATP-binding protein [Methylocystaceae bacterium]